MTITSKFPVIIPAAGIGSRMAAKNAKQYLSIQDKTILEHTIQVFLTHASIGPIVVVLNSEDKIFDSLAIASHPHILTAIGGQERVDSVLAGLFLLQSKGYTDEFVLVHDAARPCLDESDLSKLISECLQVCTKQPEISGAILASPVADTIKKSYHSETSDDPKFIIDSTVDRSKLWHAQTPQMFRINELTSAIESGISLAKSLTDEASAIEYMGKQVLLVEGATSNLKITRPSDLPLALFYLSNCHKTKVI